MFVIPVIVVYAWFIFWLLAVAASDYYDDDGILVVFGLLLGTALLSVAGYLYLWLTWYYEISFASALWGNIVGSVLLALPLVFLAVMILAPSEE